MIAMKIAVIRIMTGSDRMAVPPDILAVLRERALANGVDFDTLSRVGQAESGLDPTAASPASTARGLFQFTQGTWKDYGRGDVMDPVANTDAAARLMADNRRYLSEAGLPVSPATLYLAHFAGRDAAAKLLSADPGQPASAVLSPAALKANPFLQGKTIGDVVSWAARRVGAAAPAAGAAPQSSPLPAAAPARPAPSVTPVPDAVPADLLTALKGIRSNELAPADVPALGLAVPPHVAQARALARAMIANPVQR